MEAYELFKAIYLERGYQQREIPQLILEKNLFGLDIDERAAQLTSFALMMKGRADDRRLFERGIQLNVMALVNSDGLDVEGLANAINLADHGLKLADLVELKQLFEHATTFGSLIQVPDGLAQKLPALRRLSEWKGQDMLGAKAQKTLEPLVRQAELLAARYDDVVANPPYMGTKGMNLLVKEFANTHFQYAKSDLFACFIERNHTFAIHAGRISMVTMQGWMFLSSFQKMREQMIRKNTVETMLHIGYNSFPSLNSKIAQGTAFSLRNSPCSLFTGTFKDLNRAPQNADKNALFLRREKSRNHEVRSSNFSLIPGSPFAYWISAAIVEAFRVGRPIGNSAKKGLSCSGTEHFYRFFWEVCAHDLSSSKNRAKWVEISKGGEFRKWFGNNELTINWADNGKDVKRQPGAVVRNENYYFQPGLSWNDVTTGTFSCRSLEAGAIPTDSGPVIYATGDEASITALALNSKPARLLLEILCPTIHFSVGQVALFPLVEPTVSTLSSYETLLVEHRRDWNAYEHSKDFQTLPLLSASTDPNPTLESSYTAWIANNKLTIAEMKRLEEENNRLFIDAYGLQDELTPEVPIEQITLTVNPAYRYGGNLSEDELWNRFRQDSIKELLSYATGCMMGRYSLDHPGLILANAGDTLENFYAKAGKGSDELTFQPDRDGIIPVLDGEWFEDDIVARSREFLRVCFPASSLNTDLAFIETALCKDLRKYFCTDFYKDHLQTYKKRPIYWLVQSPAGPAKGGFACLIYLHRYTKDTLNLVLNNYFRPYLGTTEKAKSTAAQLVSAIERR